MKKEKKKLEPIKTEALVFLDQNDEFDVMSHKDEIMKANLVLLINKKYDTFVIKNRYGSQHDYVSAAKGSYDINVDNQFIINCPISGLVQKVMVIEITRNTVGYVSMDSIMHNPFLIRNKKSILRTYTYIFKNSIIDKC